MTRRSKARTLRGKKSKKWKMWCPVLLVAVLWVLLAGCSGTVGDTEEKSTLVFGDFSWDSSQIHNRIAAFIIEHGYGYPVDFIFGDTLPIMQGLERGDVDIAVEAWITSIQEIWEQMESSGSVKRLSTTFPDSPQGFYVPTYLIKGDPSRQIEPLAPDLKSVFDLPKYWELFKDPEDPTKGRFYNAPSQWFAAEVNSAKIVNYGLDQYFNVIPTGSDTALATSMYTAYERGEPWFGYYWEPTWIMGLIDMTLLEEPPFDEESWRAGDYRTAYKDSEVIVVVNTELEETAPEVVAFLSQYETTMEQTNAALLHMHEHGADAQEAALWFLREYPDHWQQWVSEDVAARVLGALEQVE